MPLLVKKFQSKSGFTLIELAIVGLIIGMLGALAIPGILKTMRASQNSTVASDLRIFSGAFQRYELEHGDWPADQQGVGEVPQDMEGYLGEGGWKRRVPIGGLYNWDRYNYNGGGLSEAVIEISSTSNNNVVASREQLKEIDELIDDGVLTSGRFKLGFENSPIYILGSSQYFEEGID